MTLGHRNEVGEMNPAIRRSGTVRHSTDHQRDWPWHLYFEDHELPAGNSLNFIKHATILRPRRYSPAEPPLTSIAFPPPLAHPFPASVDPGKVYHLAQAKESENIRFRTVGMVDRTFTCPIVYEVIEQLKATMAFRSRRRRR